MADHDVFKITIDYDGVHFKVRLRGRKRYLLEKEFLNGLTGLRDTEHAPHRPIPDPSRDLYVLTKEQLEAYSAFGRRQSRLERGFPP